MKWQLKFHSNPQSFLITALFTAFICWCFELDWKGVTEFFIKLLLLTHVLDGMELNKE